MESQPKENKALEEKGEQKKSEIIVNNTILPSQLTIAAVNDTKVQKRNDETKDKVPSTNNSKMKRKRRNKKVGFFLSSLTFWAEGSFLHGFF